MIKVRRDDETMTAPLLTISRRCLYTAERNVSYYVERNEERAIRMIRTPSIGGLALSSRIYRLLDGTR